MHEIEIKCQTYSILNLSMNNPSVRCTDIPFLIFEIQKYQQQKNCVKSYKAKCEILLLL